MVRKLWTLIRLAGSFLWELFLSNIAVARTVLSPKLKIRAGIVAYDTRLHSDYSIVSLANMITLTPGTLTLDVSEDRDVLYIHTLNIADPAETVETIRKAFEVHLLELEK